MIVKRWQDHSIRQRTIFSINGADIIGYPHGVDTVDNTIYMYFPGGGHSG